MRKTFRLVTGMCPNIRNAHRIQSKRLECTSIVNECRRNFHSDGIPAHSDTRVTRVLQCVPPALMHAEILRLHDVTELNNDGMMKLGDIHYKQIRIYHFFRSDLINDDSSLCLQILLTINLHCRVFPLGKLLSFSVNYIFDDVIYYDNGNAISSWPWIVLSL